MKEIAVQNHIRLESGRLGFNLWRNNLGVLLNEVGQPVRYGLCNDSAQLNKEIKSSDLIGITPTFITPDMVGCLVGIFTAIECKESGWVFNLNDPHTLAQDKFHSIVRAAGGYAGFATSVADYRKIIKK